MNIPYIDKNQILQLFSLNETIQLIEYCLEYPKNNCFIPNRYQTTYNNQTLISMPSFSKECTSCKLLTLTPSNINKQLPSLYGIMMLFDKETGQPLCLLDASILTAIRTGAIGGYALSLLTSETISSIGLIGCGVQGYYQLLFCLSVRQITSVFLFNYPQNDLSQFIDLLKEDLKRHSIKRNIQFFICKNSEEVVKKSDIIITATTSKTPVLPNESSLYENKTIIAIGSYQPDSRELPDAVFGSNTSVFIEIDYAKEESGDLFIPLQTGVLNSSSIYHLIDVKNDFSLKKKINIFKSVGFGLFDNVVGFKLYEKFLNTMK